MNPKLIRFALELQNADIKEEETKKVKFFKTGFNFFPGKLVHVKVQSDKK